MFRKPKKGKSSLFRQRKKRNHDGDEDGDSDKNNNSNQSVHSENDNDYKNGNNNENGNVSKHQSRKKKFRRRSSSSDEDEDDKSHIDNNKTTSALLQQIKNETIQKKGGRIRKRAGEDANDNRNGNANDLMHEYKSTEKSMTQQEMATLQAEHHPSNSNSMSSSTKTQGNKETQLGISSNGNGGGEAKQETRNKFLAGPLKASKFIRTTSRFDYQPDICKDYKDTGFCGFGDTCIYLHDRTNMKSGYIMEMEWEENRKKERDKKEKEMDLFCKQVGTSIGTDSSTVNGNGDATQNLKEEDGLPFACHICREYFKEPIVTVCNHYFCQSCILKRIQDENDQSCPVCKQDTNGVFNYPTKLVNKRKRLVGRNGTWKEFANLMKGE
jgi:RING finger protein 113A